MSTPFNDLWSLAMTWTARDISDWIHFVIFRKLCGDLNGQEDPCPHPSMICRVWRCYGRLETPMIGYALSFLENVAVI